MIDQEVNNENVYSFWQDKIVQGKQTLNNGSIAFLKAWVKYTDIKGKLMYESPSEIKIHLDLQRSYVIIIPELVDENGCFCQFNTQYQDMNYQNGILTIKGNAFNGKPAYIVTIW